MKIILIAISFVMMSCCTKQLVAQAPETLPPPVVDTLAWENLEWSAWLKEEIKNKTWSSDIQNPCKKAGLEECLAQVISIMALHESSWNPKATKEEDYNEATDTWRISYGLFQLEKNSANQAAYGCKILTNEDFFTPNTSISCMVNIAHFWLHKDKVFWGGEKLGLGRYHVVMRKSAPAYSKILEYMGEY